MNRNDTGKTDFPLTGPGIDAASAHIAKLLAGAAQQRDILRTRLAAEDVLNQWGAGLGDATLCTVQLCVRLGQRSIRLFAAGPSVDPNADSAASELDMAGNAILEGLGLSPSYRYERGVNRVEFRVAGKRAHQFSWVALAAALAAVLGFLTACLPADTQRLLVEQLAAPVLQVLLGMLTGIAMPMIFLSICTGILGIGSVAALGRIGRKFLLRFLGISFVTSAATVVAVWWLFPVSMSGDSATTGFQDIFQMILQMIPTNLVSPFLEGNSLQIIVLGICLGIALLALGERTAGLSDIVRQADNVIAILMGGVSRLLPLFVFLTFFTLIVSSDLSKLGGAAEILLLTSILILALAFVLTGAVCLRLHVPMGLLLKKTMPAFLVALTTASSAAAFPQRLEICEKRLGVAAEVTRFSVSLAQTLFKPSGCVFYSVAALCAAKAYGVPITPLWLVMCILVSSILCIATPPVAGGTKMAYSALFLQLGIPADALVLVLAAEPILDFLLTAVNSHAQVMLIALTADNLKLLNGKTTISHA